ncbi:TniQ family protein [Streptomyces sp. NPDC059781]|uniref:TniQ family protein n=1 Tax=Streptomyces sp. NPDC059781 TaxID=3346943 RepID=UPI003652134A
MGADQTAAIAHASGLDERTVTAMTLAYYAERALRINFERRYVNRWVLWGRGAGWRFCPDCLKHSSGRWQLTWRLGWSFACPLHLQLLADCCSACGRVPRQRPRSGEVVPHPALCGALSARPGRPPSGGCGFDLTQTRTLRLPAGWLCSRDWTADVDHFGRHESLALFDCQAARRGWSRCPA